MALPKLNSETFRNAAMGLGAVALATSATLPLSAPSAHADEAKPFVSQPASYRELGLPAPIAPTQEKPYHTFTFDASTRASHPHVSPIDLQVFESDKMVVYNFIDKGNRFSAMQTQVLEQSLAALAPKSQDKEIALVNVVTNDKDGNQIYGADFLALYDGQNRLGPNGTALDKVMLPYGVVYGEPLQEGGSPILFDFALLNGVQTDADLNANAEGIFGGLNVLVNAYNQKKVASLTSHQPGELVASINQ